MAALPAAPTTGFSFTSFQTNNPTSPPPGTAIDAAFASTNGAIGQIITYLQVSINADGSLNTAAVESAYSAGTGNEYGEGVNVADAPSALSALLAQAWSEYMPDQLPADTLANTGITGDHYSSRYWANQATLTVSMLSSQVSSLNSSVLALLSNPAGAQPSYAGLAVYLGALPTTAGAFWNNGGLVALGTHITPTLADVVLPGTASLVATLAATATTTTSLQTQATAATAAITGAPTTIASITALRAMTSTTHPQAQFQIAGYATAADGGEGVFQWVATDTTSADNGGTLVVDASGRRLHRATGGAPISAKWFGVIGDGSTDDTNALRNWLAALTASAAPRVVGDLPFANYLISGSLSIGRSYLTIEGNGSKIITNSATADIFVGTSGTGDLTQVHFRNLSFDATVTKTAGNVFNFFNLSNSNFINCKLASLDDYAADGGAARLWNGFLFGAFSRIWIDPGCMIIVQNNGVAGGDPTNASDELTIEGRILFCAIGVYMGGGTGGVYLNGEISRCGTGFKIDAVVSGGVTNREMFCLPGAIIDSCNDYSVLVQNNGCALLDITGSWLTSTGQFSHSSQGIGLYIAPTTGAQVVARISGARFYNNYTGGAVIAAGYVSFDGCWFDSIGGNALTIETSNYTGVTSSYFLNNTGYAIWFNTSTTINQFLIEGNVFTGNATGQINLTPGTSSTQIVRTNLGFVTSNSGSAVITTGSTSVVVAHGLVATPAEILVTCASAPLAVAALSPNGTQFTIEVASAVAGPATFYWRASLLGN